MGVAQSGLNFESSNHDNWQQTLWKSPNQDISTFGKLPLTKNAAAKKGETNLAIGAKNFDQQKPKIPGKKR